MGLHDEIFEQPDALQRLLQRGEEPIREIASRLREQAFQYVFLVARGTSDHAGLYAKYLWGMHERLPMALATPSTFTLYDAPPKLDGSWVVGISQSGQSPDLIAVMEEAARQKRPTLTITNDPDSPLAEAADHVIDILAGPETAVAATKTYTAQLLSIAMLSVELSQDDARREEMQRLPEWVSKTLELDEHLSVAAQRYRYLDQCVVLGRGYNYATAFEWSLKMKELTYTMATPYSSADFRHGPIAVVAPGFPVLAVAPRGKVHDEIVDLLQRLESLHQAELVILAQDDETLALAETPVPLPADVPEWLTPIVSIVAAQLFTYHLTRAKGFDTEQPRGLQKVTKSR
ncbi:MAG: SIS domain-containing protein [Planctomycetota bacterium]